MKFKPKGRKYESWQYSTSDQQLFKINPNEVPESKQVPQFQLETGNEDAKMKLKKRYCQNPTISQLQAKHLQQKTVSALLIV